MISRNLIALVLTLLAVALSGHKLAQDAEAQDQTKVDVCVYGGTPAGITAAIAAAREGASVVLLEQTKHVGGLNTSGLNRDEGEHMHRQTLGGLSERFTMEAARRSGTPVRPSGARVWESRLGADPSRPRGYGGRRDWRAAAATLYGLPSARCGRACQPSRCQAAKPQSWP